MSAAKPLPPDGVVVMAHIVAKGERKAMRAFDRWVLIQGHGSIWLPEHLTVSKWRPLSPEGEA